MSTKPLTKTPTLKRSRVQAEDQDNNYDASENTTLSHLLHIEEGHLDNEFSYSLVSSSGLIKKSRSDSSDCI
jgi:hypothetical protein